MVYATILLKRRPHCRPILSIGYMYMFYMYCVSGDMQKVPVPFQSCIFTHPVHILQCSHVCRQDERIYLIVCVRKKLELPLFPQQNWVSRFYLDFAQQQLHNIIISSGLHLNIFCDFVFTGDQIFHILWSWLLTQRIALPCIRLTNTLTEVSSSCG